MLHFASVGLSCLLLFGAVSAPCTPKASAENEKTYRDTAIVYDDDTFSPLSSSVENYTIRYQTKDHHKFDLAIRWPTYTFAPTVGSCAPIAASNLVGFYDRYDENLIPDHTSGSLYGTGYIYTIEDDAVELVIQELHSLMGTTENGTTEDQFLDGLKSFCSNKGKSVSVSSCMSGKTFSFSKAQSYIENNIPIVLFLSGYTVGMRMEYEDRDEISYYRSDANHVMVGFGYSVYNYQTSDGAITKNYFNVAAGLNLYSSGIYDIGLDTKINDALAIQIY